MPLTSYERKLHVASVAFGRSLLYSTILSKVAPAFTNGRSLLCAFLRAGLVGTEPPSTSLTIACSCDQRDTGVSIVPVRRSLNIRSRAHGDTASLGEFFSWAARAEDHPLDSCTFKPVPYFHSRIRFTLVPKPVLSSTTYLSWPSFHPSGGCHSAYHHTTPQEHHVSDAGSFGPALSGDFLAIASILGICTSSSHSCALSCSMATWHISRMRLNQTSLRGKRGSKSRPPSSRNGTRPAPPTQRWTGVDDLYEEGLRGSGILGRRPGIALGGARGTFPPEHQGRKTTPLRSCADGGVLREYHVGVGATGGASSPPATSPSLGMTHHRALEPGSSQGFSHATSMDRTRSKPPFRAGLARPGYGLADAGRWAPCVQRIRSSISHCSVYGATSLHATTS